MADLTITAANVLPSTGANINTNRTAGETITAGMAVYLTTDNTWKKAQHDGTQAEAGGSGPGSDNVGIALNGASSGQPLHVLTSGDCTIGATVTVGERYFLSATAGGICPTADVASTDYVTFLGLGITAAVIRFKPLISGIQAA